MKKTIYRPVIRKQNEWDNILEERRNELSRLKTGKFENSVLHIYLKELLLQAQPLSKNTNMRFFGFDRPSAMPADARVDYFYWPTYISTACCMKAIFLCPEIINMIREDVVQITGLEPMAILADCMRGCTGLGFFGHGYENIQGLVETMDFFTEAHVQDFIAKYPHVCPEFTACFKNAVTYLADSAKNGKVAGVWGDDHTDRALVILDRLGINIDMEVC